VQTNVLTGPSFPTASLHQKSTVWNRPSQKMALDPLINITFFSITTQTRKKNGQTQAIKGDGHFQIKNLDSKSRRKYGNNNSDHPD
jgi:hypothetical protein